MKSLVILCLAFAAAACASTPGGGGGRLSSFDLTPPPLVLPAADDFGGDALLGGSDFSLDDAGLDWGVGLLELSGRDAIGRADVPLFDAPEAGHWGWFTQGRVVDQRADRSLTARPGALYQPPRHDPSFLVLDTAAGGWLKIRWGRPDDLRGGLAWTRRDLIGGRRAVFTPWDDRLRRGVGLVFRNEAVAHNLRSGPTTDSAVVHQMEGTNFDLSAVDVRGDWMRVRYAEPPACAGDPAEDELLGASQQRTFEGWIRWRSDGRGPWIKEAGGLRCGRTS